MFLRARVSGMAVLNQDIEKAMDDDILESGSWLFLTRFHNQQEVQTMKSQSAECNSDVNVQHRGLNANKYDTDLRSVYETPR
jgi:hypothetical protein